MNSAHADSERVQRVAVTTSGRLEILDKLHGAIHLRGPESGCLTRQAVLIRRALMLRQLLKERHPHLSSTVMSRSTMPFWYLPAIWPFIDGVRSRQDHSTSRQAGQNRHPSIATQKSKSNSMWTGPMFMVALRSPKLQPALREKLRRAALRDLQEATSPDGQDGTRTELTAAWSTGMNFR